MATRLIVALAALALASFGQPAAATGTLECDAVDGRAGLRLTVGSLPVLSVVRMDIAVGEEIWSTDEAAGRPIRVGQAFQTADSWRIDATDPNVEAVVAEVRLWSASEGSDTAFAGTLKVTGGGAFAIACVGP